MLEKVKKLFGAQDMTVGKPMNNLLKFAIPLLIGNFAQQLYSTVDSIVVGKYVGDTALSSIGTTGPIINMLLVLFMAISTGVGIMVAQYFGAKDHKALSMSVGNALTLITISSLLIMLIGIPFAEPLLRMINTPAEIFDMSKDYLVIILCGIIGGGFYNIVSGILRGLGDSFFPLCVLILTSVLNIVLDIWFVAGLDLNVFGAGLATILSQGISAVILLWKLYTIKHIVHVSPETLKPRKDYTLQLLKLGLPSGITQAIFSLAMVFVQSLTNSMGYLVTATSTAVMRIDGFAMMPNFTFGMCISTFIGQNIGARRLDRCEEGTKAVLKIAVSTSVVLIIALMFFGGNLLHMFTNTEDVINLGIRQLRILAVGYLAMCFSQIFGGIMRGAGDTMPTMWISLVTTVLVRTPIAYLIAAMTKSETWPNGNPDALYFSLLLSWVLGAVLNYIWYRRGNWKKKSLIGSINA